MTEAYMTPPSLPSPALRGRVRVGAVVGGSVCCVCCSWAPWSEPSTGAFPGGVRERWSSPKRVVCARRVRERPGEARSTGDRLYRAASDRVAFLLVTFLKRKEKFVGNEFCRAVSQRDPERGEVQGLDFAKVTRGAGTGGPASSC